MATIDTTRICDACNEPFGSNDGCTVEREWIGADWAYRIVLDGEKICSECGAHPGKLHHAGCSQEQCPSCLGNVSTCGHQADAAIVDPRPVHLGFLTPDEKFVVGIDGYDDHPFTPIDATAYLAGASDDEILMLAHDNFAGIEAEFALRWIARNDKTVREQWLAAARHARLNNVGFTVLIEHNDAMEWIALNRPYLLEKMQ